MVEDIIFMFCFICNIIFGFLMYRDWVKDCLTVWKDSGPDIMPGVIAIFMILFSTFWLGVMCGYYIYI